MADPSIGASLSVVAISPGLTGMQDKVAIMQGVMGTSHICHICHDQRHIEYTSNSSQLWISHKTTPTNHQAHLPIKSENTIQQAQPRVAVFCVSLIFHLMSVRWNLGLIWKVSISASCANNGDPSPLYGDSRLSSCINIWAIQSDCNNESKLQSLHSKKTSHLIENQQKARFSQSEQTIQITVILSCG